MADQYPEELLAQGYQARREGRPADALRNFGDALAGFRESGKLQQSARALAGLGQIERDLGNTAMAARHYRDAVAILRSGDQPLVLAHTIRHLGDILRERGELDEAVPCLSEALEIYRRHKEAAPLDVANAIRVYALLKGSMGNAQESAELWREAGDLYQSLGLEAGVSESKERIASLMQG